MASSNPGGSYEEEHESIEKTSFWSSVWLENKGAILILLGEAFGSSTDAIARYLQQGDHGIHALQVLLQRSPLKLISDIHR